MGQLDAKPGKEHANNTRCGAGKPLSPAKNICQMGATKNQRGKIDTTECLAYCTQDQE